MTEWVAAAAAAARALAAAVAGRSAHKSARLSHQPQVRVVAGFQQQVGIIGSPSSSAVPGFLAREMDHQSLILKNTGTGPAHAVIAFDPENAAVMGKAPIVEPLGPGPDEAHRIGRVVMPLNRPTILGHTYELYYQDRRGAWHATQFRVARTEIEYTFEGEVRRVPPEVAAQGSVKPT
jgi:hypothetical protein